MANPVAIAGEWNKRIWCESGWQCNGSSLVWTVALPKCRGSIRRSSMLLGNSRLHLRKLSLGKINLLASQSRLIMNTLPVWLKSLVPMEETNKTLAPSPPTATQQTHLGRDKRRGRNPAFGRTNYLLRRVF